MAILSYSQKISKFLTNCNIIIGVLRKTLFAIRIELSPISCLIKPLECSVTMYGILYLVFNHIANSPCIKECKCTISGKPFYRYIF